MPVPRGYHHGDLRTALVAAGLELARAGGVDAITVREVTRVAGVTPNAAYRHFADHRALVVAVSLAAQDRLADAMRARIGLLGEDALSRLRGVGLGYIDFALAEPGWFELALVTFDGAADREPGVTVDDAVPPPFMMLMGALNGMVAAGLLTPAEREHAEWPCWSAVHGFADIATRGPLQTQPREVLAALGEHVVDRCIAGLKATSGGTHG